MSLGVLAFEFAKLILQFAGAAFIAWKTVGWALRRYQKEKMWERRLGAYTELIVSLSELMRLNRLVRADLTLRREKSEEEWLRQDERYRAAKLQLDESIAVAHLLLPSETQLILQNFEQGMASSPRFENLKDHLEHDLDLLEQAIEPIVKQGRMVLQIDKLEQGG